MAALGDWSLRVRFVSGRASRISFALLAAVAAGGAAGAVLRWWLGVLAPDPAGFPWTTFAINVLGSLLLALLPLLATHRLLVAGLGPGLLGGFTTLSAAAEQTRSLLASGDLLVAVAFLVGTLAACLVAIHLASLLTSPRQRSLLESEGGDE